MRPGHETPWTKYIALVGILLAAADFCGLRMVKHGTTRCKRFPPGGFDSMGVRGFGIRRQPDCAGLRRRKLKGHALLQRDVYAAGFRELHVLRRPRCEECHGTGTNPHLNSTDPKCPHCSATGVCPECDGSGNAPICRSHKGNVFKYGIMMGSRINCVLRRIRFCSEPLDHCVAAGCMDCILVCAGACHSWYSDAANRISPRSRAIMSR